MEKNTDFDHLSRQAARPGSTVDDLMNLAAATFALPYFLFIARGEAPNINPYIAANAGFADGKPMIRAFTDSTRLLRFAQENNLTDAGGAAAMLEMPTNGIIDYLEKFSADGVAGIWFNADSGSESFSFPMVKLRPIKERLVKTGWTYDPQAPAAANLENWGLSQAAGSNPDLRIRIFKTGNVNPGASILPYLDAIKPLLADYRGSGDFQFILNFLPGAMQDVTTEAVKNEHGEYLRLRTFKYHANNNIAHAATIDTNVLQHITTGATLLISFAILDFAAGNAAAIYFKLEGARSVIATVLNAIEPVLIGAGFVPATA